MLKPQTIQIFLPDGNPRSVKIAELTNRTVKAVLMPRNKITFISEREELNNVGLYFLFGIDESRSKPLLYIGEAENCLDRIKNHNSNKEFWSHAVVMISSINVFTKSHVKYLENLAVSRAKEVNRFELQNANTPTQSFVTESMEADLLDSFETMEVLLSTLGYPVYDRLEEKKTLDQSELFYLKGKDAVAEGDLIDDGFVVFKGAKVRKEVTKSSHEYIIALRNKLLKDGILSDEGKYLLLKENYIFGSPSTAAAAILGRTSNGWRDWKNKEGKTLDELKRR